MDEAERCNHVILLHEGEVLAQGTAAELAEPLEGHTFLMQESFAAPRTLQSRTAQLPNVVDTVIHGDGLRIVMQRPKPPLLPQDIAALGSLQPVPPRLEDAFVSLLFQRSSHPPAPSFPANHGALEDGPVVEVRNLCRKFGDYTAVKDISFSVNKGEIFGLLGANGAGKSTTFRMLCGLLPPTSGTLHVAGMDLRRAPAAARARIGYVSQKFSLYAQLSVQQNLAFFSSAYGLARQRKQERIEWALEELELKDYLEMNAGELPLGYKQRLALACALMHEPRILFLDEPTSGVDPLARREFWARVNALAESGTTCLVTTHFMEEAEYCDRLVLMSLGEILAEGKPADLRHAVRRPDLPAPDMEDAFVALVEQHERATRRAS
jgi:ABC-2 type transport system ATP-binding protein